MRSCSAKTEKEDLFFADVVKPNVMEEHERGDIPAPRCENDAAPPPHVAASGVNGEGDNCGGDDVHGERERIGLAHGGGAGRRQWWRWWRQRRGKTVGLEKREGR